MHYLLSLFHYPLPYSFTLSLTPPPSPLLLTTLSLAPPPSPSLLCYPLLHFSTTLSLTHPLPSPSLFYYPLPHFSTPSPSLLHRPLPHSSSTLSLTPCYPLPHSSTTLSLTLLLPSPSLIRCHLPHSYSSHSLIQCFFPHPIFVAVSKYSTFDCVNCELSLLVCICWLPMHCIFVKSGVISIWPNRSLTWLSVHMLIDTGYQ